MTEKQAKLNHKTPPPPAFKYLVEFKAIYRKYEDWLWGVAVIGLLLLMYYEGKEKALQYVLYPALIIVVIANAWQMVKWVIEAPSQMQKTKRVVMLTVMAVCMSGGLLYVNLVFKHTDAGQWLQGKMYTQKDDTDDTTINLIYPSQPGLLPDNLKPNP